MNKELGKKVKSDNFCYCKVEIVITIYGALGREKSNVATAKLKN